MTNYAELLLNSQWRKKRSAILLRDKFLCRECGDKWLSDYRVVYISNTNLTSYKNGWWAKGVSKNPTITCIPSFLLYDWDKEKVLFTRWKSRNIIAVKEVPVKIASRFGFEDYIMSATATTINEIESFISDLPYAIVYSLNVHHTYYIDGKLPWEYDDDALVTLCWECHEKLHQGGYVPVLNASYQKIDQLPFCSRCHGVGWFPEFSHIQDGICFRCYGAKYEGLFVPYQKPNDCPL